MTSEQGFAEISATSRQQRDARRQQVHAQPGLRRDGPGVPTRAAKNTAAHFASLLTFQGKKIGHYFNHDRQIR